MWTVAVAVFASVQCSAVEKLLKPWAARGSEYYLGRYLRDCTDRTNSAEFDCFSGARLQRLPFDLFRELREFAAISSYWLVNRWSNGKEHDMANGSWARIEALALRYGWLK